MPSRTRASSAAGPSVGADPGVVAAQPPDARAAAAPRDVGDEVERAVGQAPGHPSDDEPAGAVAGEQAGALGERAHTAPEGLAAHREHALDHGDEAGDGQQDEHDGEQDLGDAEPDQAGGRQHGDEPVGPLGDADVGGHPEPFGAGLGVLTTLPRIRQASASPAIDSWPPRRRSRGPGRRRCALSPTRSRVESR